MSTPATTDWGDGGAEAEKMRMHNNIFRELKDRERRLKDECTAAQTHVHTLNWHVWADILHSILCYAPLILEFAFSG